MARSSARGREAALRSSGAAQPSAHRSRRPNGWFTSWSGGFTRSGRSSRIRWNEGLRIKGGSVGTNGRARHRGREEGFTTETTDSHAAFSHLKTARTGEMRTVSRQANNKRLQPPPDLANKAPRCVLQGASGVGRSITQLSPPRPCGLSCNLEPLWRVVDFVCHLQTPPPAADLFKASAALGAARTRRGELLAGRWGWSARAPGSPPARMLPRPGSRPGSAACTCSSQKVIFIQRRNVGFCF